MSKLLSLAISAIFVLAACGDTINNYYGDNDDVVSTDSRPAPVEIDTLQMLADTFVFTDTVVMTDTQVGSDTFVMTDTYVSSTDTWQSPLVDTFIPSDIQVVADSHVLTDTYTVPSDTYQLSIDTFVVQDTYVADTGPEDTTVAVDTVSPLNCDDGNDCTIDANVMGVCEHSLMNCDDGDACTVDSCVASAYCTHEPMVCPDDGSSCTTEYCVAGECQTDWVVCPDDGDFTTYDYCSDEGCVAREWFALFWVYLGEGYDNSIVHVYNSGIYSDLSLTPAPSQFDYWQFASMLSYHEICDWGIEIAIENADGTWWDCNPGTPSKNTIDLWVGSIHFENPEDFNFRNNGSACGGQGLGNLYFSPEELGCPTQTNPASVY